MNSNYMHSIARHPLGIVAIVVALPTGCCTEQDKIALNDSGAAAPSSDAAQAELIDAGGAASSSDAARAELIDQTPPSGSNGLAFDAEGMIWLADYFGDQVLKIDPANGEILERYNDECNGAGPDDIAIDEQGRVFWTGFTNGVVGRIDPNTRDNVIIAELPVGANPIAFSDDGRLFVGLAVINDGLYELDPEGVEEPVLIADALDNVNAFDFGPDGFLYGPQLINGAVVKIDVQNGEIVETIADGYGFPCSVRYSEDDNLLYILSANPKSLSTIDLDDYSKRVFATPETQAADNFAIGPDHNFYITGFDMPRINVVNVDGSGVQILDIGS